jgi:hypothetical protein
MSSYQDINQIQTPIETSVFQQVNSSVYTPIAEGPLENVAKLSTDEIFESYKFIKEKYKDSAEKNYDEVEQAVVDKAREIISLKAKEKKEKKVDPSLSEEERQLVSDFGKIQSKYHLVKEKDYSEEEKVIVEKYKVFQASKHVVKKKENTKKAEESDEDQVKLLIKQFGAIQSKYHSLKEKDYSSEEKVIIEKYKAYQKNKLLATKKKETKPKKQTEVRPGVYMSEDEIEILRKANLIKQKLGLECNLSEELGFDVEAAKAKTKEYDLKMKPHYTNIGLLKEKQKKELEELKLKHKEELKQDIEALNVLKVELSDYRKDFKSKCIHCFNDGEEKCCICGKPK